LNTPLARDRPRKIGQTAGLVEEFWDLELIESLYRTDFRTSPNDFRDAFHQRFERRGRLLLTGSARHALRVLLAHAAGGSRKRRVLLSSFNCRVVRDAVLNAALAVDTFDFATPSGQIDWELVGESLTDEHLAVVVPHFYGIPTDFAAMVPAARRKGVLIVEDCAHALGASIAGTRAGQLGDAAVFSFNYDKPISLAGGGALLINHSAVEIDRDAIERYPPRRLELRQFRQLASTLLYGRRREHPPLWARIGAKLHVPPYAAPGLPSGIGSLRAAAGIWQLQRYDEIRDRRNRNAQRLESALGRLSWHVGDTVKPAYLKLRVVVSRSDAAFVVGECRRYGITIANSNWPKLIETQGPDNERINAKRAAAFGLDVPVHQNLSRTDIENIATVFATAKAPDWRADGRGPVP
jgi:dTDP-4-amino-4,6-dideoxygalactose transaminase